MLNQEIYLTKFLPETGIDEAVQTILNFERQYRIYLGSSLISSTMHFNDASILLTKATLSEIYAWNSRLVEVGKKHANILCEIKLLLTNGEECWDACIRNVKLPHVICSYNEELSACGLNSPIILPLLLRGLTDGIWSVVQTDGNITCGDVAWIYIKTKAERLERIRTSILTSREPAQGESVGKRLYELARPILAREFESSHRPFEVKQQAMSVFLKQCDDVLLTKIGDSRLSEAVLGFEVELHEWLKS